MVRSIEITTSGAPSSIEVTTSYTPSTSCILSFTSPVIFAISSNSSPFTSTTIGAPSLPNRELKEFSSWRIDNSRPTGFFASSRNRAITFSGERIHSGERIIFIIAVFSPSNMAFSEPLPSPTWLYIVHRESPPTIVYNKSSRLPTAAAVRSICVPSGIFTTAVKALLSALGINSVPMNGVSKPVTTSNNTAIPITHQRCRTNLRSILLYLVIRIDFTSSIFTFLPESWVYNIGITRIATNKEDTSEKVTVQAWSLNSSPEAPWR